MSRYYERSISILLLVLVFSQAFVNIYDFDVWFHIEAGEYMLANWEIPDSDVFSYTALGSPWIVHEWLFEVLIYIVYAAGTLGAVTLFKALVLCALFAVYLRLFKRLSISPALTLVLLTVASILARERFIERPEIITYLFSAVFISAFEVLRINRTGIIRWREERLWLFPVLMVLWANFHSGAVFAIAICGAYWAGELISALLSGSFGANKRALKDILFSSTKLRVYFLILIITFAVGFINPNTYHVYTYPFVALDISAQTGLNLAEYSRPLWATDSLFFVMLAISVLIILLNIIFNLRGVVVSHIMLFIFFSALALKYNRNIAIWAVVVVPFVAFYIEEIISWWPSFMPDESSTSRLKPLFSAAAIILSIVIVAPSTIGAMKGGWWGPGIKEGRFPEGAVRFLDEQKIEGNMYNSYEFGGYLLWRSFPERKVYIDGRSDIYTELLMEQRKLSIIGFEKLVEKYDINYLIMSYSPSTSRYINPNPVFGRELALVWFDDVAMVYLRRSPGNMELIKRLEYRRARPTDLSLRFTDLGEPALLAAELKRNINEDPGGWRAKTLLRNLYKKFGNAGKN